MAVLGRSLSKTTSKIASMDGSQTPSFKTWCLSLTRDWPERALLLSFSQALLISALELTILLLTLSGLREMFGFTSGTAGIIVIYFALFLLAQIFQALLSLDAFWSKNTVQVVAIGVFNICVTAYAFVQIRQLSLLRTCGELFVTAAEDAAQDLALASWNILILVVGTNSRSW
jgi:hypothetical protein